MPTKIIALIILVAAGVGAVWFISHRQPSPDGFDRTQNILPPETKGVLDTGQRFVLLSLDPTPLALRLGSDPPPKETFHDYAVLGKTEIRDQKERVELLRALYKGIKDSGRFAALCFNPRHGISATLGDETVDLVICFECAQIQTHAKYGKSVLTTRSPAQAFNRALEKAGLPIAKDR